jgi:hypothetical protein
MRCIKKRFFSDMRTESSWKKHVSVFEMYHKLWLDGNLRVGMPIMVYYCQKDLQIGDVVASVGIFVSKSRSAEDPGVAPRGSDDGNCICWSCGRTGKIDCGLRLFLLDVVRYWLYQHYFLSSFAEHFATKRGWYVKYAHLSTTYIYRTPPTQLL